MGFAFLLGLKKTAVSARGKSAWIRGGPRENPQGRAMCHLESTNCAIQLHKNVCFGDWGRAGMEDKKVKWNPWCLEH